MFRILALSGYRDILKISGASMPQDLLYDRDVKFHEFICLQQFYLNCSRFVDQMLAAATCTAMGVYRKRGKQRVVPKKFYNASPCA